MNYFVAFYYLTLLIIAIWTGVDAYKRKVKTVYAVLIGISTFIIWPIVLPIYFAKRNLRDGETREGGTSWNLLKNFSLSWTAFLLIAGGAYVFSKEQGLLYLLIIWFITMSGALIIGKFLKKPSHIEKGPTGKLVSESD